MTIDFGRVAKNYAKYRNDVPSQLMESLKLRGIDFTNKKIADLGAGTGVLSRELCREGAVVTGIELSAELIKEAKEIDRKKGLQIEYIQGRSESIPLPDDFYDMITVLRAWHWFDRNQALIEIKRILKDHGILIIMDSGFVSNSNVVRETLAMLKEHMKDGKLKPAGSKSEAKQQINSFPVEWFKEWKEHGFDLQETYKFSYNVKFTNEEWCGRAGSLSWLTEFDEQARNQFLNKLYTYLEQEYKGIHHNIPHGCYISVLRRL